MSNYLCVISQHFSQEKEPYESAFPNYAAILRHFPPTTAFLLETFSQDQIKICKAHFPSTKSHMHIPYQIMEELLISLSV